MHPPDGCATRSEVDCVSEVDYVSEVDCVSEVNPKRAIYIVSTVALFRQNCLFSIFVRFKKYKNADHAIFVRFKKYKNTDHAIFVRVKAYANKRFLKENMNVHFFH